MVRKLKHFEQKLLRKVDFTTYKSDHDHREAQVCRRYHMKSSEYTAYNRLCGSLRSLAHRLAALDPSDPVRRVHEEVMLETLWECGVLGTGGGGRGKLSDVEHKVTPAAFARRRIPLIMTRLGLADNVQAATRFIEQGHIRCGTDVITDSAFIVTR
jgi:U3 small nucleolar ribonucleoprotein protein IMP3